MKTNFLKFYSSVFLIGCSTALFGQNKYAFPSLPNEKWWGGVVTDGTIMPLGNNERTFDLNGDTDGNQAQPLFVSNKGRYIWSEEPFKYTFTKDSVKLESKLAEITVGQAGKTLKEAYLFASKKYFPASGKLPHELLFTNPQYNTWIELIYNQNQEDILKYAHAIIDNGFPPGVFMIDDTWQTNYGIWEFNPARFKDPKKMMDELHGMGFKVMLWICPFVSADSENFRKLRSQGALLTQATEGKTSILTSSSKKAAVIEWWNGYSGLLDFTNPKAVDWFKGEMNRLQTNYGVDGFKFDAGDAEYYTGNVASMSPVTANKHSELYAKIGLDYPLNEYRACWKMAGQPLAQRLRDKRFLWEDVNKLIPDMLLQGIMGFSFICPDLIGGGEYASFLGLKNIDQEMIVRSAQVHVLMPMMQFSVAPWRVLDAQHLAAVKEAAFLHKKMENVILNLAKESAKTGEPIARMLEYNYPNQGFEQIKDQFMLGTDYLVAPVLTPKTTSRPVVLPKGKWKDQNGKVWVGGKTITVEAPLNVLPYFTLVK